MSSSKFMTRQIYFSYLSIAVSLALISWSHFDKVQREHKREQQQATVDAIDRDCQQLQRESDTFYLKLKTLTKKRDWTAEDFKFARHASQKSKSLAARYDAIQRRCRDYDAANRNQ